MNIQLQTNNFNGYNQRFNKLNNKNVSYVQPSFTAGIGDIPQKSKLLNPISRAFDGFTTWLKDNYTNKLYTSWFAKQLAKHADKLDSVVDIMAILGSVVISGMYITQTMRNKQLDDDRKQTLAINQALTFGVATLGSVVIDQSLDKWWEGRTEKYAQSRTGLDIGKSIKEINDKAIKDAEEKLGKTWKQFTKKERKGVKLTNTLKYVEEYLDNPGLEAKLRGMGVLKKLIVFGTVYRFISPVAVTPLANMLGNKIAERKQAKREAAAAQASQKD